MSPLLRLAFVVFLAPAATGIPTDQWESLPSPPFLHGFSSGGGLASDGRFVYAADFSGDGDNDFIDLNDNGAFDSGESLSDLGITNASVRFARFDPIHSMWQTLPSIDPLGYSDDSLSCSNFNHAFFFADGWLYYYQFRDGPERCVLHRYELSSAPGGSWETVWDKEAADALIGQSAGMIAVATPFNPVILHHRGGGAYEFCRTSAFDSGGEHVVLTPDWPLTNAVFPRNGAWGFDALRGRLYHMSGNQLVAWSPSTTYKDPFSAYERGNFLTTTPIALSPLAMHETPIASLKSTLGWDPGGSFTNPGASLWGNSVVVINDPSGVVNGPDGEDTGANVVYLVRGETSSDAWPFNEGRGVINNGDVSRWFATTGNSQALPDAPFHVGKGSDALYLGGYLYLTQGDTANSEDTAGNVGAIRVNGIRRPGDGFARFRISREYDQQTPPQDEDISVAWIQRLPSIDYVWGSSQSDVEGWPAVGSTVIWRAFLKNWRPAPREDVGYRWLIDGVEVAAGSVDMLSGGYTTVDLPWTWTFDRHGLALEIDPCNYIAEASESNNRIDTWTDAITVGFWVEHSFYQFMHDHQQDLGIGSNSFEDWAQRQVLRWNQAYAAAAHPFDCPDGVLDRVRLDKVTLVADNMLPLTDDGDVRTNKPDKADRTVDLMWGFPSWKPPGALGEGYLEPGSLMLDTFTVSDFKKPFYYDGVLFHETSHARYLVDVYGYNVDDVAPGSEILITVDCEPVAGTPYMPRYWPSDYRVFYIDNLEVASPFHGLMHGPWTYVDLDRYSAMALNLIAGRRAMLGNYNLPGNAGAFLNDLPAENAVQLVDGHGDPIAGASVQLYRGLSTGIGYGKSYDNIIDATYTANADGVIEVGRNPFTSGGAITIPSSVAILRVDRDGHTGFGFLPAAWFQMEYWRGNSTHGRHELVVPMIGPEPEIAQVLAWAENENPEIPENEVRRLRIILGGLTDPSSVSVDGQPADYHGGGWWITLPGSTAPSFTVVASWPGGPTLREEVFLDPPPFVPTIQVGKIASGLRLGWWSRAGYHYRIWNSPDLSEWMISSGDDAEQFGTGGWIEADVEIPPNSHGFSRLEVRRLAD